MKKIPGIKLFAAASLGLNLLGLNLAYAGSADDKRFLDSFKSSFMDSCIESSGGEQFKSTCSCVLDDVIKNFSVADLKEGSKVSKYIENVAMDKCQK